MAASLKNWRDKVWLVWFALQVLIILCKLTEFFDFRRSPPTPSVQHTIFTCFGCREIL